MTDLVGRVIGERYEVAAPIAAGSMGSVWIVRDPDDKGWLALKTIATDDESYSAPERFLREIESLQRVDHPNVVQLVDFGWDDGLDSLYMVTEMVHGDPVSRLLAHGRLPEELAVHVAIETCSALEKAHEQNVVHRDIKPANLMVRPRNDSSIEVKVLDFGLAFLRDEETRLTRKGTTAGTALYASPEQLRGEITDGRSDIYSLGVVLYEMVSGRPPFHDRNIVNVAHMQMTKAPKPLTKVAADVSPQLGELVAAMLQKRAADRPATAAEVRQALILLGSGTFRAGHRGPARDVVSDWKLR
jgi:serine/threonine-protein kinase